MPLLRTLFLAPNSSLHFSSTNHNFTPRPPLPSLQLNPRPHLRRATPPPLRLAASSSSSNPNARQNPNHDDKNKPRSKPRRTKPNDHPPDPATTADPHFPSTIPRKPRRGRPGEAAAVEDFVRASLERTFASIRANNSEILAGKEPVLKPPAREEEEEKSSSLEEEEEEEEDGGEEGVVVEEEDPDWPVDAEVGWGVRASEYFDKHPIKNVVVEGEEIDWEGEVDEGWVKEINCLEWERFAFHPSPLIVLVFERYNR